MARFFFSSQPKTSNPNNFNQTQLAKRLLYFADIMNVSRGPLIP
jgi:hypothetical protein